MQVKELFETPGVSIKNAHGMLKAKWKKNLKAEEDDEYLPAGYDYKKVLELEVIEAKNLGVGDGKALMDEFLNTAIALSAELIFLDPNPNTGKFDDIDATEDEKFEKLHRFYSKFGFRSTHPGARMWRVQKGNINDNDLPT